MSDDGRLVGRIFEAASEQEPPTFEVIRGSPYTDEKDEGCAHNQFALNERWRKVTCGKCGDVLDAFAVLMRYAEWSQRVKRKKDDAEWAEMKLLRQEMRRLKRLVDVTDDEVGELEACIDRSHTFGKDGPVALDEARKLTRRVERAVRERKLAKKRAKREAR